MTDTCTDGAECRPACRIGVRHKVPRGRAVDFCDGLPLFDEHTGERISMELFVGALGSSSYTFAWAMLSQDLGLPSFLWTRESNGVAPLEECPCMRKPVQGRAFKPMHS